MREAVFDRLELRNSFECGLARGEFYVVYQPYFSTWPRVSLRASRPWSAGSTRRSGRISPAEFIPLAEETGFIVPLGQLGAGGRLLVRGRACSTMSGRRSSIVGQRLGPAASGRPFVEALRTTLAYSGLRSDRLTLEMTESVLTHDPSRRAETLIELKQLGARIAIDDFGTGYSSLSYLSRFPIDVLKIDKSFVDPLGDPARQGRAFVGTIIGLARQLGLSTVAEGIETEAQCNVLAELGCELAQGFLLARPMSADEALTLAERITRLRTWCTGPAPERVARSGGVLAQHPAARQLSLYMFDPLRPTVRAPSPPARGGRADASPIGMIASSVRTGASVSARIRFISPGHCSAARSSHSTTNSSPPSRATVSAGRTQLRSRRPTSIRTASPASWPKVSFTRLKPLRSQK